jgi:hypothetical protein
MKKVLIANRGEIARRVIRTLKKMNIQSVAIYSDADKNAPHVLEADEAVYVGKSPSAESYLQQDLILQYCKDLGVDGIHPGYGFLSENAGFAKKVKAAGMKLIGPSPESMEVMGDKLSAKQAVKKFNVPLVPGVDEAISDVTAAKLIAEEVRSILKEADVVPVGPDGNKIEDPQIVKNLNMAIKAVDASIRTKLIDLIEDPGAAKALRNPAQRTALARLLLVVALLVVRSPDVNEPTTILTKRSLRVLNCDAGSTNLNAFAPTRAAWVSVPVLS